MTLVVARIAGGRVAIAADTLLTEHDKPLPYQSGVIKSCMLPGDICVSFANSPVTAERAFRVFIEKFPEGTGFDSVVVYFEESSRETGNDYIIAFSNPARLVKIADGKRQPSLAKTAWIGDPAAYSRFREFESPQYRKPQHGRALNVAFFADEMKDSPASDLFSIMRNVVADPTITNAGGFVSVVSSRDNGFRFSVYCDMLYDWPEPENENYQFALAAQFSLKTSGENANFSIAQISPGFMSLNLAAFYFVKARKLFFFHGDNYGLANKCTVFTDVAPTSIYDVLNSFVRIDLKWLVTITSPRDGRPYEKDPPGIETPGSQISFMVEANTFPKPTSKG